MPFSRCARIATESALKLIDKGVDSLRSAPDACADEFDRCHEVGGALVKAGGDVPELLAPIEEAFDQISLTVEPRRVANARFAVGSVGNDGSHASRHSTFVVGVAVATLVFQQGSVGRNGLEQRSSIVDLTARQPRVDRTPLSVNKTMDFAGKAAQGHQICTTATVIVLARFG